MASVSIFLYNGTHVESIKGQVFLKWQRWLSLNGIKINKGVFTTDFECGYSALWKRLGLGEWQSKAITLQTLCHLLWTLKEETSWE